MSKLFNVKHICTLNLSLEKGGNESVASEYNTDVHFYKRINGKNQESTIDQNLKPIVDIASRRWYYDKCTKLTTDGNVVKSIKEVGNKVISTNYDLGGKAHSLEQLLKAKNGIAHFTAMYNEKNGPSFQKFTYSLLCFNDNVINDLISIVSFMEIPMDTNIELYITSLDKSTSKRRYYTGNIDVESYETLNPEKWLNDVIINTWINW